MIEPGPVRDRVEALRDRIGRPDVRIVAVTKGFGPDAISAAAEAGLVDIGENYAQELIAKLPHVDAPNRPFRLNVHFIGRLQSNKVGLIAPVVDLWQSVDRFSLVSAIVARRPGARVLVQVNVSDEPSKGGCAPADAAALVDAASLAGLRVEGLMTVGRTGSPTEAAVGFRMLRRLVDGLGLEVCSMGMSGDLDAAVAEGSTMVRIGTALFGSRGG